MKEFNDFVEELKKRDIYNHCVIDNPQKDIRWLYAYGFESLYSDEQGIAIVHAKPNQHYSTITFAVLDFIKLGGQYETGECFRTGEKYKNHIPNCELKFSLTIGNSDSDIDVLRAIKKEFEQRVYLQYKIYHKSECSHKEMISQIEQCYAFLSHERTFDEFDKAAKGSLYEIRFSKRDCEWFNVCMNVPMPKY